MIGNLYAGKLMFDIHPRIAYNLVDQDFSRVLTLHQDFKRKDLLKEGNRPYSITYRIAYALPNTHHSYMFLRKEYIEISKIFKKFAKVIAPDPIRISIIDGVNIVIKDHPILDQTLSSRTEFNSRMYFSEDRIMGYKGKEKELLKALTPQKIRVDNVKLRYPEGWKEIQQHVIGRYESMLKIAGHEILVAGVAGREREIESSKWKWEDIHTQRVDELKQVYSNLAKLAIPQDEDGLVVYTDANDYRWETMHMKKTTIGEESCKYTRGLFSEQQS
ncbi:movement protein [Sesamum angolense]|uniref:Movement protein n=1 Tax=Sesamum angolense TaxID=2727404 RepID=A0AAE2BTW3_9LAMI|nr:movement protein [Sesamum angolense]